MQTSNRFAREWRRGSRVFALATALLFVPFAAHAAIELKAVSSRADAVSGGNAVVEIVLPAGASIQAQYFSAFVKATLNQSFLPAGTFRMSADGHLYGLISGLTQGSNSLSVTTPSGAAQLTMINHPLNGPVISGPQQSPFICQTQTFGLGAPLDANCNIATKVQYWYRSTTTNTFKTFDPNAPPPSDLAHTTTSEGITVPYVVRLEIGTINRAVYEIAILNMPGQPLPDPWTSSPSWNGKLIYTFGGGCGGGHHQGATIGQPPLDANGMIVGTDGFVAQDLLLGDDAIARGYAMADSTLTVFGTNCNGVISAETMSMVKEHFIKTLGVPRYTIGNGASGGSMQQHLIGTSYPGLLDGILPQWSFPDTLTFQAPLTDCALIDHAFNTSGLTWTLAQKTAVAGSGVYDYCKVNGAAWANNTLNPTHCDVSIPAALVYNPVTNPQGARCTLQDTLVNVFGADATTNFARRSLDNVGVQYGLAAFNAGTITFDQFLDVNQHAGGFDIDGNMVATRTVGDLDALRLSYQTGQLANGSGGLPLVPIIDVRAYLDDTGNVHDAVRSQIMRARLMAANGTAANQIVITAANASADLNQPVFYGSLNFLDPASPYRTAMRDALDAMDQWLANISNDNRDIKLALKVIADKPANLVDACYTLDLQKITDPSKCKQLFPSFGNPRLAAGEPLTEDFLKCQTKPIVATDYAQPISAAQLQALQVVFPGGVCDYSKPAVEQQPLAGTWLFYTTPGMYVVPAGEN